MTNDRRQILHVIDDDRSLLNSFSAALMTEGWTVHTYASATEFLNAADLSAPGVILLDYRMPGMSGLDVMAALKNAPVTPPVIMMTAFADVPLAVRATQLGAVDVLEKPFHINTLLNLLESLSERHPSMPGRNTPLVDPRFKDRWDNLTMRQQEVLRLVMVGHTSGEVASILGVSRRTVEAHRAAAALRLKVHSVAQLVAEYGWAAQPRADPISARLPY